MIYTCTLNPSLDYYLNIEKDIEKDVVNRSNIEFYEAGGKGVNVSILLNNFKVPSIALGFLGGFVKEKYLDILSKYSYIQPLFVGISETTRINVKFIGKNNIHFNAKGPSISDEEWLRFKNRLKKIDSSDLFVLSGNIQDDLHDKAEEMIKELSERNIPIFLDVNPKLLLKLLKYKPFLIKPNHQELKEMFEDMEEGIDGFIEKARLLHQLGAKNIIVSLAENGSIFLSEGESYYAKLDGVKVINTTGAGDSMVAGFVLSLLRGGNNLQAYRYSVAASYATINNISLATREEVEKYYELIEVKNI